MRILFFILILNSQLTWPHVLNKGRVFDPLAPKTLSQKFLLPYYYLFNKFNTIAQNKINKNLLSKASQVSKTGGYYLRINSPNLLEQIPTFQKFDNQIFPFTYQRDGFFYLTNDSGINTQYGFCSGFAHGLRKFDYLAFYNPGKAPESIPSYKDKIDLLFTNTPVEFNGIKDLRSLVEFDPKIEFHIRKHLADQWGIQNARIDTMLMYGQHYFELREELGKKHFLRLYKKLKYFLESGFQPLVFHFWGSGIDIHVLRVLEVGDLNFKTNEFDIVLYDFTSELKYKTISIPIARWYQVLPGEDLEMVDYSINLENHCKKNSRLCLKKTNLSPR